MEKTQFDALQEQKKEYQGEQFALIYEATDLLDDLIYECLSYLQSFPELRLYTAGESIDWLDFDHIHVPQCWQQDMLIQCMSCCKFLPSHLVLFKDLETNYTVPKRASTFGFYRRGVPVLCGECFETINHESNRLLWCEYCNLYYTEAFFFQNCHSPCWRPRCPVSIDAKHRFYEMEQEPEAE